MRTLSGPVALVCALLCLPVQAEETHKDQTDHLSEMQGLRVLHPWALLGSDGLQIFLEIENRSGQEVILTGGQSHSGADLVLVATRPGFDQSDIVGEIPIADGADMELAPQELYFRLSPAPDYAVGDRVAAHLTLDPLGDLDIEIEIFPVGTDQHPHAGHNH